MAVNHSHRLGRALSRIVVSPCTEDMKIQGMICFLLKLISRLEFRSRNIFLLWSHHKCLFGCIKPVPWQYEVCTRTRVLEHSCEVTLCLTACGIFRSNYDDVKFYEPLWYLLILHECEVPSYPILSYPILSHNPGGSLRLFPDSSLSSLRGQQIPATDR